MAALFRNLFNGDPWLDITILGTLSGIMPEKAAKKPAYGGNSIWEITNHVVSWREAVLARIHGAPGNTPSHNYFLPVNDTSAEAWKMTLEALEKSQETWLGFLLKVSEDDLQRQYLDSDYTVYDLIHGILQHDAYHLGQLTLLAKYDL